MPKITIIAEGAARTPRRDELGRWEPGQYLGRDTTGEAAPQEVDDTEQVRRAIARGDLRVVLPTPPGTVPVVSDEDTHPNTPQED